MADIQHSSLTDPNLHEPKGASTATAESFYVANGAGSGSWKLRLRRLTATSSGAPSTVSANSTLEQTFTVSGVALATDHCVGVSKPTHQTGLGIVGWRVSADNTVAITYMNNTGVGITPTASQTYQFFIWRE